MASSYLYHTTERNQGEYAHPKPEPGTQTKWPESPCRIRYVRR